MVLLWRYRWIYEILWEFRYGGGFRGEVQRLLDEASKHQGVDDGDVLVLENFVPTNLVEEDWAMRTRTEIALMRMTRSAEPILFDRLMRAKSPRTVRKIVTQSKCLAQSELGEFLRQRPERFIAIKTNSRFPQSTDRRINFLAQSVAAVIFGYRPSTGRRYLAKPELRELCEQCGERRAVMDLISPTGKYAWCGAC